MRQLRHHSSGPLTIQCGRLLIPGRAKLKSMPTATPPSKIAKKSTTVAPKFTGSAQEGLYFPDVIGADESLGTRTE